MTKYGQTSITLAGVGLPASMEYITPRLTVHPMIVKITVTTGGETLNACTQHAMQGN